MTKRNKMPHKNNISKTHTPKKIPTPIKNQNTKKKQNIIKVQTINKFQITLKDKILITNFNGNKQYMNQTLDCISNIYEGTLKNREGHNFPSSYIPKDHILSKYKNQCLYVIGIYQTNSLAHELLHAKYFIDAQYRTKIINEWMQLNSKQQKHITSFLKRLGYSERVIIDEYQAYRYTEKPNFFGIKIL